MAGKSLSYSDPENLRDRIPDSDLIELTTEGSEAPENESAFLDSAVAKAKGESGTYTEAQKKVGGLIRGAIVHGEGRVNSRVGAAYDLPALGPDGTAPPEIEDAVLVLAEEKIRDRRPRRQRGTNDTPDIVRRANEIRSWLKSVSKGNSIIAMLSQDNTEEKQKSGASSGTAGRGSRQFSSGW